MPYGNSLDGKNLSNNRRFGFYGLPLDKYMSDLQFAYSVNSQLLRSYTGNIIEVIEDDGGTTKEFKATSSLQSDILSFVGANNGYIVGIYDQISGIKTSISTGSQQIQIVNAGTYVSFTNKYSLEIPKYTTLTVSGIAACNRMKNLSLANYIAFKGEKSIANYTNDYVYPIKCAAGLMDFSITNGTNVFWYNADGGNSTADRPATTLTNSGNTYMFATNIIANNIQIKSNNTNTRYTGSLKDIPRLTYYLEMLGCSNITGSLADLGGNITYYLGLSGCTNITGSLADLQGKITNTLNLNNCTNITGSLADLQGKITNTLMLENCLNITGSLADLQGGITYYLGLRGCPSITGSLAGLQGKVTNTIDLYNCTNITGSLADLGGNLTYRLILSSSYITGSLADLQGKITFKIALANCVNITGSLADLQGKLTNEITLSNCSLVTGVYTPVSTGTPVTFNISNTGLSASDVDNTLIACYGNPKSGVTFTWTGLSRTSASNTAATALDTTYNWTFSPAL